MAASRDPDPEAPVIGPGPVKGSMEPIAEIAGRIDLLVAYLASPALLRRFGRDDLVADVVVRLLDSEKARGLEGEGLWRFARAVTRNTIVDAARKGRNMPRRMSSMAGADAAGSGSTLSILSGQAANSAGPRSIAASREASHGLLQSFLTLAPEHRRVIGLRRFEGLNAEDAGARMGRSGAAIHSLFRRALEAWSKAAHARAGQGPVENSDSPDESRPPDR